MNPRDRISEGVNAAAATALALSHRIHGNPELGWEEFNAVAWLSKELETGGYAVTKGVARLPTAFVATIGTGPLVVGLCAEYDALPVIGHACGHNIIAGAAIAAALALAPLADELGITVKVFGTPAEENGGGKAIMLDAGVFDGTHAAMMIHPGRSDASRASTLAISDVLVEFTGKNAHASAAPQEGINAGDALTLTQVAIGLLRQQLHPDDQIHGIVTNGGEAPNIIPGTTAAHYYLRARDMEALALLQRRVWQCFEGAALATGCLVTGSGTSPDYAEFRNNEAMATLYQVNAESLGRSFENPDDSSSQLGSTDMGNVSRRLPAIHPTIGLDCGTAVNHQPEFAAFCVSETADKAVIDGALAMAWTIADIAADPDLRQSFISGSAASPMEAMSSTTVTSAS